MPLIDMAKPDLDSKWRNEVYPSLFVTEELRPDMTQEEKFAVAQRLREPG